MQQKGGVIPNVLITNLDLISLVCRLWMIMSSDDIQFAKIAAHYICGRQKEAFLKKLILDAQYPHLYSHRVVKVQV